MFFDLLINNKAYCVDKIVNRGIAIFTFKNQGIYFPQPDIPYTLIVNINIPVFVEFLY